MSTSRSRDRGRGGGRGGITCYRCGGEGYISRDCAQKKDVGGPSHIDLGGGSGDPVDLTASPSPERPKVRGRGEKKYYEGEEREQDSFARQEVRQSPRDKLPVEANETLNWAQSRENEQSASAGETLNWGQPKDEPSKRANETSSWDQTVQDTSNWAPPEHGPSANADEALNWKQPYVQQGKKGTTTASSTTRSGGPPFNTLRSKPGHLRGFQPQPQPQPHQSKPQPHAAFSDSPNPTAAPHDPTSFLGQSGDVGFIQVPIMVSTTEELGNQRMVVFVCPKEGYTRLRYRLERIFGLDVEIALGVRWRRTGDEAFPEGMWLDEGNFEGVMALVGKRGGGDVIVVVPGGGGWKGEEAEVDAPV